MMASRIDPRDHELLRRIAGGEQHFKPEEGEETDSPSWLQRVERLRRLRDRGWIRMNDPERYYNQPGYTDAGPCELTADGWDVVERFGR
jgi:hypothetical protein